MKELSVQELLKKTKEAKSAAEIQSLAKENGIEITTEEAVRCFARLHPQSGDIPDEELENIAGGGCHNADGRLIVIGMNSCSHWSCLYCGQPWNAHTNEWVIEYLNSSGAVRNCPNGISDSQENCSHCGHCSAAGGFVVCNHPANHT